MTVPIRKPSPLPPEAGSLEVFEGNRIDKPGSKGAPLALLATKESILADSATS